MTRPTEPTPRSAAGRTTTTAQGGNQGGQGDRGTTIPSGTNNSAYIDELRAAQSDLDEIAGDLNQANTDWEDDGVSPSDAFTTARDEAADWAASVSEITPPDDAVATHGEVVEVGRRRRRRRRRGARGLPGAR